MVLDSAVDPSDWVTRWQMGHLTDTDAVWASFSKDCFDVGAKCPLWRIGDTGQSAIDQRISDFLGTLKQKPVYAINNGNARPISYRDVRLAMYWTTMVPAPSALRMVTTLDAMIRGHTNTTVDFPFETILTASTFYNITEPNIMSNKNTDAAVALNCGDQKALQTPHFLNSNLIFKPWNPSLTSQPSFKVSGRSVAWAGL